MPTSRALALAPVLLALALTGCGGGDANETSAGGGAGQQQGGPRGGGMFTQLTDEQRSCIEKQGVELPEMPQGGGGQGGGNGQPPEGYGPPPGADGQGAPPEGAPQGDGQRPQRDGGQFQELREAMEKCGVELPERPQGAPGQGGGTQTTPQAQDATQS